MQLTFRRFATAIGKLRLGFAPSIIKKHGIFIKKKKKNSCRRRLETMLIIIKLSNVFYNINLRNSCNYMYKSEVKWSVAADEFKGVLYEV